MLPKNAHRNARVRKAWLERRKEIITPECCCQVCGVSPDSSTLQIHHMSKEAYKEENFHLYEKLSPLLPFIVVCKKCHFTAHRGLDLCPVCQKYYKARYRSHCFRCAIDSGEIDPCPVCGTYKIKEKEYCWGLFCPDMKY